MSLQDTLGDIDWLKGNETKIMLMEGNTIKRNPHSVF